MATEMKKLEDIMKASPVVLPKYLVVAHGQDGYHELPRGKEVYEVDTTANKVFKMELSEDRTVLERKAPVIEYDAEGKRIFYIQNTYKDPYIGRGAIEVALLDTDTVERAILDLFTEFVLGRNAFGVTIFATDILGEVAVAEAPAEGGA